MVLDKVLKGAGYASKGYGYAQNFERGGDGTQEIPDEAQRFAEDVVELGPNNRQVAGDVVVFGSTITLVGQFHGRTHRDILGLSVPTHPARVEVEAIAGDESVGSVTITEWGTKEDLKEKATITRATFYGEHADERVVSYLATVFRELTFEGYQSYIGARKSPPGVSVNWDDLFSMSWDGVQALRRRM